MLDVCVVTCAAWKRAVKRCDFDENCWSQDIVSERLEISWKSKS